ncbi:hypothetical protein LSH36_251g07007 [Paralvinella palmiformis]|uniref:Uncharacterized protein n=1 Tax=Paralvinella palmiformis TaxID=53620 RepID=A0AAD9JL27_9ANNE|nr:hypothetical protein LSH36_251g07007 [Paralvinella palmiformis]
MDYESVYFNSLYWCYVMKQLIELYSEIVFASRWLAKDPEVLLLHTKCSSNAIQVSVKGRRVHVVSAVAGYIQDILTPGRQDPFNRSQIPDTSGPAESVRRE